MISSDEKYNRSTSEGKIQITTCLALSISRWSFQGHSGESNQLGESEKRKEEISNIAYSLGCNPDSIDINQIS